MKCNTINMTINLVNDDGLWIVIEHPFKVVNEANLQCEGMA